MRDQLPHLKGIVQYKGKLSQNYPHVYDVRECTSNSRHVVCGKLNLTLECIPVLCPSHNRNMCLSLLLWEQFLKLGEDLEEGVLDEAIKAQKPEQCALIVHTVSYFSIQYMEEDVHGSARVM